MATLDPRERERAAAFVRPRDRARYITAHAALRQLLSGYLAVAPEDIRFVREPCPGCGGPHGRPAIDGERPPLHFSLSHSGELTLVGVAASPLGVDVQKVPRAASVAWGVPALHPAERAELNALPGDRRPAGFAALWARKEAYLKGLGIGLGRSPAADYLGRAKKPLRPAGWTVLDVPADTGYAAAAAIRGQAPSAVTLRVPATAPPPYRHGERTRYGPQSSPSEGTS